MKVMKNFGGKIVLKFSALAAAGLSLSGCVYDVGLGYASDGYYGDSYGCDPYGGYDSYYQCDYGHGFYNIGYGGGWYDSFWYPGYGFYLFDNVGRRYPMRDHHKRYWGEKRHNWYRENNVRNRDGGRYQGRGRGYTSNATPGAIGWPEQNGGRVRDDDSIRSGRGENRMDGRRGRNRQWTGGEGNGTNAVPVPNAENVQRPGRARERGERMRSNPERSNRGLREYGATPGRTAPQAAPAAPRVISAPRVDQSPRAPVPRQNRTADERVRDQ